LIATRNRLPQQPRSISTASDWLAGRRDQRGPAAAKPVHREQADAQLGGPPVLTKSIRFAETRASATDATVETATGGTISGSVAT